MKESLRAARKRLRLRAALSGSNLYNLAGALRGCGLLYESELNVKQSLVISRQRKDLRREAISLAQLGSTLAMRGESALAESAQKRGLRLAIAEGQLHAESQISGYLAQLMLGRGATEEARALAERARECATEWQGHEYRLIAAIRIQGLVALQFGNLSEAEALLSEALTRTRNTTYVTEELWTLLALASLHRQQGNLDAARELLDEVWEPAERGEFRLDQAHAFNLLAQIERDTDNKDAAVKAATEAFRISWCDGLPFDYRSGLEGARVHLTSLSVAEPVLPSFDVLPHEPMPDIEVDTHDRVYYRIARGFGEQ